MKDLLSLFFVFTFFITNAQNLKALKWINENSIAIEDANPETKLIAFAEKVPDDFKNARIFGFGEATHYGKEFFDLKTKFFKHLVENQGVKLFIMEESYQAEAGINEWISGGKGDEATILKNFGQGIWYCQEVVELLKWMREYNRGKTYNDQVRFYGMDNQFGHSINLKLRKYVEKYSIKIDEELLVAADSCSQKKLTNGGIKNWSKFYRPKLKEIEKILISQRSKVRESNIREYDDMVRAIHYLQQYTFFIQAPHSKNRDQDMYDNVVKILDYEGDESKAFLWAHNEHINKKDLYTYKMNSLGRNLKNKYKNQYLSVGFDFGNGSLIGYVFKEGEPTSSIIRELTLPYKDTFAETLFLADSEIYYIDLNTIKGTEAYSFFNTENRQLFIGGPGFDPDEADFLTRKYSDSYDALIFVKTISPATYGSRD